MLKYSCHRQRQVLQKHASSLHEFVQRAVSKAKLGHPKPLWYDVVVKNYPPLPPFRSSLEKRPEYPLDSDDHVLVKKKSQMSKEERMMLNWKHLFPKMWDDKPLPKIIAPEDAPTQLFMQKYPLEKARSALDPLDNSSKDIPIDILNDKDPQSYERSLSSEDTVNLIEEKLAKETSMTLGTNSCDIEPNSVYFSNLDTNAPSVFSFQKRRRGRRPREKAPK